MGGDDEKARDLLSEMSFKQLERERDRLYRLVQSATAGLGFVKAELMRRSINDKEPSDG